MLSLVPYQTFKSIKNTFWKKKKADENMVSDLDYEGIENSVSKKDFGKIEKKNHICINVFCYENNLVYPVHILNQNFEDCMDLLMITNEN